MSSSYDAEAGPGPNRHFQRVATSTPRLRSSNHAGSHDVCQSCARAGSRRSFRPSGQSRTHGPCSGYSASG